MLFTSSDLFNAVWNFRYNNAVLVLGFLNFGFGAYNDPAFAGSISLVYSACTVNCAVGREVRTFDKLH